MGDHARAGLICSDCHNPHSSDERHLREAVPLGTRDLDSASRLCAQCHSDVRAQLTFPSHHPLVEGAMGCMSCHDPHADRRASQPEDKALCASCHQDFAGPWIFEHPPVVESCMTCHSPHGAVADNLLATVQPVICLSCHSLNDTFHHDLESTGILTNRTISQDHPEAGSGERITRAEAGTYLRRCTDCHGAIHGSYTDEHLRH
jgi:DmsE family decaheme c-type cytochrome